ncbi:MAG: DUF1214 domain-containing protein [Frankiales bacterium]|nr:DUF1214 domain-containing protein [Frankiales bacterium]
MTAPIEVTVENFARAESDRMLAALQAQAGGVNVLGHNRAPTAVHEQPVIRMNRDTLYSYAVVDLADDAVLTLPDAGDRYVSAMVVSQDHFVEQIEHDPGEHVLRRDRIGTRYALVAVRILVDPADPADTAAVVGLQNGIALRAGSADPFELPDYEQHSFDDTRDALLSLARGLPDFSGAFGARSEVDPVRHLVGSAAGWGGLPTREALYLNVAPGLPPDRYVLRVPPVPVDGFWSLSVYNAHGYFEPNELDAYSVNSVTGVTEDDGSLVVHLGDWGPEAPNRLPLPDGWNYVVRLYRPRPEITDGRWTFPTL